MCGLDRGLPLWVFIQVTPLIAPEGRLRLPSLPGAVWGSRGDQSRFDRDSVRYSGKLLCISSEEQEFKMRPIFVGNFEYDTRQSELERFFSRYGRVERVDMKSGFAFVYMSDERDADDAIRGLDNREFGRQRRRLSVEWARGDRGIRHREGGSRAGNSKPTKTLFVINFDPYTTRVRDLERHFEPYGKLMHVRIRRNFAFVQYETQEEATKALDCTHMSKVFDRVISVEYAIRDDDDDRNDRRESPVERGIYGRQAERGSPGYGRSDSPIYGRRTGRASPDYGRASSPVYDRYRGHVNDRNYGPVYDRYR
ncbi:hypothetical protein KI387_018749, partial [Taxus chinensis]